MSPDYSAVVLNICLAVLALVIFGIFVWQAWEEYKLVQVRVQEASQPIIKLWHNETAPLTTSASKYLEMLG